LTHIFFPRIIRLHSHLEKTRGSEACVLQMGAPELCDAIFNRERDFFRDSQVTFWKPFISMASEHEAEKMLYDFFKEPLKLDRNENRIAVRNGFQAMAEYHKKMQDAGKAVIQELRKSNRMGILILGHPYHYDTGINHHIPDLLSGLGYPVLTVDHLPSDADFLRSIFGEEEHSMIYRIDDVWSRNFNRNINYKIWAAKLAARHPNLAVVDLSSFKCGFDACTYSAVAKILDTSRTPHFLFHDIDQNKPGSSFQIRIETINYFLKQKEKTLQQRQPNDK
jgi:predicted nucleotide-binding protein (sugar kinase/HSP70/actin superfamily)